MKFLILADETRTRDILPYVTQLRKEGHNAEIYYNNNQQEEQKEQREEEEKEEEEDICLILPHSEDHSYLDGSWNENDIIKPNIKMFSYEQIENFKKKKMKIILIHNNQNTPIDPKIQELGIDIVSSYNEAINRILFDQINSNEIQPHDNLLIKSSNAEINKLKMVKRVIFVRHAERLDVVMNDWWKIAERPQDSPLSPLGIDQSIKLGEWFSKQKWCNKISAFYVSPFARTVQTAHFMLEAMKNKTIPINIEYGLCEGAPWMSVVNVCREPWYLKAADLYCLTPSINLSYNPVKIPEFVKGPIYPGRPIETELWYDRCAQTTWRLLSSSITTNQNQKENEKENENENDSELDTIVIVTHGGCIGLSLHCLSALNIPMIGNTGFTSMVWSHEEGKYVVELDDDGKELFVRYDHLPEDYITGHHPPVQGNLV